MCSRIRWRNHRARKHISVIEATFRRRSTYAYTNAFEMPGTKCDEPFSLAESARANQVEFKTQRDNLFSFR